MLMGADVLEVLRKWPTASEARLRGSGIACELVESPTEFDPIVSRTSLDEILKNVIARMTA